MGALVTLVGQEGRLLYFIGPGAGGTQIVCNAEAVTVITPQSPIGRALVGLKAGEGVPPLNGRGPRSRIVAID
jgi:transcription elongation GreA/GreB family factor